MIKIYTVYDTVADIYSQPFYLKNNEIAKREIKNLVNDNSQPNLFNTNIEDKILYLIGEFDENKAIITPLEHERVIHLKDLKESPKDVK